MNKSKAKSNAGGRRRPVQGKPRPTAHSRKKPVDLRSIRQEISSLVAGDALGMVDTVIEEARKGQYTPMKYLFELIGLYPAAAEEEGPLDDSLVQTLLRRLGFPEAAAEGDAAPPAGIGQPDPDGTSEAGIIPGVPVE